MKQISIDQLQANQFYWARRKSTNDTPAFEPHELEIVRISTVFGTAPEFWTVAISGNDEHFDLEAYEYLHRVAAPSGLSARLTLVGEASTLPQAASN